MYRDAYQRGLLTVFYSCGSKPLNIWDTYTQDGYITKLLDEDIRSTVLEIGGTNVSTTYMICPKGKVVLGITMPFLVMIVKNLKKYFSFEVTILDDTGTRRRFRVSNFQSTTQILPLCTVMPIALSEGWNQIQFNMSDFCRRAYKKQFVEVQKFKINANIRVRRIYFADRIFPEDQLPAEYKLFIPLKQRPKDGAKDKPKIDEAGAPEPENAALKKKDSKLISATKVTKSASFGKALSQVQEFEKASSKAIEGVTVTIKPVTEDPSEGGQSGVVSAEETATPAKEPVAESGGVAAEEPVAQAEEQEVQVEEPAAQVEEPAVQQQQESVAAAEVRPDQSDAATDTPVTTEETGTQAAPERQKSVEAQTQTESITTDKPSETPDTKKDEVTRAGSNLEPIAE